MSISYLASSAAADTDLPPLFLIHGAGVSARSWTNQILSLGQALPVVAIDLPGHGQSPTAPETTVESYADAAHRLARALGTGPVIAVGHSLGGSVALALAARHPESVRALVLVSTCAKLPARGGLESLLAYLPSAWREAVFYWIARRVLFGPRASAAAVVLGMGEIRACQREVILRDAAAARAMDLEKVAPGVRVPTLILCGSDDRLTPPALSRRLHALIPGSRLEIVHGVGHMLPLEAPARINREIAEFVGAVTRRELRGFRATAEPVRSFLRRWLARIKALFRGARRPRA